MQAWPRATTTYGRLKLLFDPFQGALFENMPDEARCRVYLGRRTTSFRAEYRDERGLKIIDSVRFHTVMPELLKALADG